MDELPITDKSLLDIVASMQIVGHQQASKEQLEQAIFLWFHKDVPGIFSAITAIHTLAVAVQGILWAYAHDSRQQPPKLAQTIEKMPPEQRARLRDPQNFFKHGNVGRKEKEKRKAVSHLPDLTDLFLVDDVCAYNRLFMRSSGLMDAFLFRYWLTFPESGIRIKTLEIKLIGLGANLETLRGLDRKTFYDFVTPYATENLRDSAGA
jgi:hypothetical protein